MTEFTNGSRTGLAARFHPALLALALGLLTSPAVARAASLSPLDACLDAQDLSRVVRVASAEGPIYARVVSHEGGVPKSVVPIATGTTPLREVFDLAASSDVLAIEPTAGDAEGEIAERLCSPVPIGSDEIERGDKIIVAAGLNYAAHAEEAGGGDVFVFPKPSAPTPAYAPVVPGEDVLLLDYEVELGFVLLEPIDLRALPPRERLLGSVAFLVTNDVSDREPIIANKALSGPGTGFSAGKGQPTFLPAGPWMIRGSELMDALAKCDAAGLGMRLEVDEGAGFVVRQSASTERMILEPLELLGFLAATVDREGVESPMVVERAGRIRHYPLAVDRNAPHLPAGSLVLTGTPEGVALLAPNAAGVAMRGLIHLRSPFEQFNVEERARALRGEPGGYLRPGSRMRARIDGLGTQIVEIATPGTSLPRDPCADDLCDRRTP
jgi:2-keto-4-pentenoate hydratase/2-oxohepta-3-ene-1,7-dioic acid hydratase in catechol pathway